MLTDSVVLLLYKNSTPLLFSWSMYEWEDMNGELKWLTKELETAESNGELVHIVSHVPPGENYFKTFQI